MEGYVASRLLHVQCRVRRHRRGLVLLEPLELLSSQEVAQECGVSRGLLTKAGPGLGALSAQEATTQTSMRTKSVKGHPPMQCNEQTKEMKAEGANFDVDLLESEEILTLKQFRSIVQWAFLMRHQPTFQKAIKYMEDLIESSPHYQRKLWMHVFGSGELGLLMSTPITAFSPSLNPFISDYLHDLRFSHSQYYANVFSAELIQSCLIKNITVKLWHAEDDHQQWFWKEVLAAIYDHFVCSPHPSLHLGCYLEKNIVGIVLEYMRSP